MGSRSDQVYLDHGIRHRPLVCYRPHSQLLVASERHPALQCGNKKKMSSGKSKKD